MRRAQPTLMFRGLVLQASNSGMSLLVEGELLDVALWSAWQAKRWHNAYRGIVTVVQDMKAFLSIQSAPCTHGGPFAALRSSRHKVPHGMPLARASPTPDVTHGNRLAAGCVNVVVATLQLLRA